MRTLRSRLILSHLLPLLVVVPLMGIVLIYLFETQLALANMTEEIQQQAAVTAGLAADQPELWLNRNDAQLFVRRFSTIYQATVTLIDPQGNLIASTDPNVDDRLGQPLDLPRLPDALAGESVTQHAFDVRLQADVIQVLMPVTGATEGVVGVVRLTNKLSDASAQFQRLRYLIIGGLALELLVGAAIGLVLAFNLERSLRRVTDAIYGVANGRNWTTLPEQGPEEMRTLLRAFNALIDRLRLLEESRQQLLANIVHEVGRPIGALQSAIQALINGADQDDTLRRELLAGMKAEVERLHPLLDNLVNLHGQVLGALELSTRPVRLDKWLTQTAAPWREAAQAKGLAWQADVPLTLPTVDLDPDRMAQALGNLLSNAIKYTPAGGNIRVTAEATNGQVQIVVSDTGPGINPAELAQIFEPFYRSQRQQRFPQGLGLGLSLARDLVEAHGGQLWVDSQEGQGSRFTISLPQLPGRPTAPLQ